jgi:hypothetical protein
MNAPPRRPILLTLQMKLEIPGLELRKLRYIVRGMKRDREAIVRRLQLLQDALGVETTAKDMADFADVGQSVWSEVVHLKRDLSIGMALDLRAQLRGVTLDWLYAGDASGLAPERVAQLKAVGGP